MITFITHARLHTILIHYREMAVISRVALVGDAADKVIYAVVLLQPGAGDAVQLLPCTRGGHLSLVRVSETNVRNRHNFYQSFVILEY